MRGFIVLIALATALHAAAEEAPRTQGADTEALRDAVAAMRGGDCDALDTVVGFSGKFVDASYELAMLFAEGICVDQDEDRAFDLSTWNCERQGDPPSCDYLSRIFLAEPNIANQLAALVYSRFGAYEGYAPSMQRLGWIYAIENGPAYDLDSAIYWYHRAAESGLAAPMYNLFFLYASRGPRRAPEKARQWLEQAAEAGSPSAWIALARHYEHGSELYERDTKKAVFWREKFRETGLDGSRIQTPGLAGDAGK